MWYFTQGSRQKLILGSWVSLLSSVCFMFHAIGSAKRKKNAIRVVDNGDWWISFWGNFSGIPKHPAPLPVVLSLVNPRTTRRLSCWRVEHRFGSSFWRPTGHHRELVNSIHAIITLCYLLWRKGSFGFFNQYCFFFFFFFFFGMNGLLLLHRVQWWQFQKKIVTTARRSCDYFYLLESNVSISRK